MALWTRLIAGGLTAGLVAGCELLVPDTVPTYTCAPGTGTCPAGMICNQATQACIYPADVVVVPDSSMQDQFVDEEAAIMDVVVPPEAETNVCRGLGCKCSGGTDCDSRICADATTVTPGPLLRGQPRILHRPMLHLGRLRRGLRLLRHGRGRQLLRRPEPSRPLDDARHDGRRRLVQLREPVPLGRVQWQPLRRHVLLDVPIRRVRRGQPVPLQRIPRERRRHEFHRALHVDGRQHRERQLLLE